MSETDKEQGDNRYSLWWYALAGVVIVTLLVLSIQTIVEALREPEPIKPDKSVNAGAATEPRMDGRQAEMALPVNAAAAPAAPRIKGPADPFAPYGDYKFREALPDTREAQYKRLLKQAEAQPTNSESKRSLVLSTEEVEALKKSGDLIY
jgi:hypothetical protein